MELSASDGLSVRSAEELLRTLVLMPSSNVDDRRGIARFAVKSLESFGFECRLLGPSESPAIIAPRGSGGLLLSGHLDTVPIGDAWSKKQGEIEGRFLYGRGAADMKGGCTAILMAAAETSKSDIPLTVVLTTDEETGMSGADSLAREPEISSASAIVICEPTSLTIGLREKGLLQLKLMTSGRSAHAAMPQLGENAIHKMLLALDRLEPLSRIRDGSSEKMTLSIDVIRGGTKVNVIPDACEAEIDVRTPPNMKTDEALEVIQEKLSGVDCQSSLINRLDPISIPPDAKIVRLLKRITGDVRTSDIAYATEMIKYKDHNNNIVAFGPGDPRQAHRMDERIDLDEVVRAARIYVALASNLS